MFVFPGSWSAPTGLAVWATVNILDWKLVLVPELSVGCLQQPTALTIGTLHKE